jgi:tRNA(Ile)-lysidine synthase
MKKVFIRPGTYVLAVSGGVDSVVLLDLLSKLPGVKVHVAHFDHGIRSDSANDAKFVKGLTKTYGVPISSESGKLGPNASEAAAREKRYEFLQRIKRKINADAIVTAHHQDDVIETAIINMIRGTGRRGLSSLKNTSDVLRPLLDVQKKEIIAYAVEHRLAWHEDSTNEDETYLRNYVRRRLLAKFSSKDRQQLLTRIQSASLLNEEIDNRLHEYIKSHTINASLDREWFTSMPHTLSREVLLAWLRTNGIRQLNRRRTDQLVVLAKTLPHGKLIDVDARFQLKITTNELALITRER